MQNDWIALTQTVCSNAIEKFDECKAQIQQQKQEQIPRILIGKYQSLPVVQFILDAMAKAALVLMRQRQHIDGNNFEAVSDQHTPQILGRSPFFCGCCCWVGTGHQKLDCKIIDYKKKSLWLNTNFFGLLHTCLCWWWRCVCVCDKLVEKKNVYTNPNLNMRRWGRYRKPKQCREQTE